MLPARTAVSPVPGLHEFARRLGAQFTGEDAAADIDLQALAAPGIAGAQDVTFALGEAPAPAPGAAAVLAATGSAAAAAPNALVVADVRLALCRAADWLPVRRREPEDLEAGQHPRALVSPHARVGARVRIGEGSRVAPGAVIGDGVSLGDYCEVGAGAVLSGPVQIGNRCRIGPGCVVGTQGFAFVQDHGRWHAMPGFGGVRLGDDVVLLAQATVHAGVFGDTVVGARSVLDTQVLIGHDARLGADCALAGQAAVAGAARLGDGCRIGGKSGIGEGVVIADRVTVTAMSMVTRSLSTPDTRYGSGWPAEQSGTWWRRVAALRRLSAPRPTVTRDEGRE